MTFDEQLALASVISDGLSGKGVALVKDASIVIDEMSEVDAREVVQMVKNFVSKRKDANLYEVEAEGNDIEVHTPDPLARSRGRKEAGEVLPPNVLKCPYCLFVTEYKDVYDAHVRAHVGFLH